MYGTQLQETFLLPYHKQSDGIELATEMGLILLSVPAWKWKHL
jgi:hypothetical protein